MLRKFYKKLRSVLAPDPDSDIVDWLEKNVKTIPYSPMPGGFRIDNTPQLKEIFQALQDPEVDSVAVMGPVQTGKSLLIELYSMYIPCRAPGPTIIYQDTDPNAKDFYETRLKHLWRSNPCTKEILPEENRDSYHTINFLRNVCWILGGHNKRNMQRRSARYVIIDEAWQWKQGYISEAFKRITAYKGQSKILIVSQGGKEGDDFSQFHASGDRREWCFLCPDCGTRQPYKWEQVIYPGDAKEPDGWNLDKVRQSTTYKCVNCETHFKDSNSVRAQLNASACWIPMNGNAPSGRRSYHYNSLCMTWGMSWGDLAVECIEAKRALDENADETKRMEFKQKREALPWADTPDVGGIEILPGGYKMGDEWEDEGAILKGKLKEAPHTAEEMADKTFVRLRFLSVDVQRNGMYWLIRLWSLDGRSRLYKWGFHNTWDDIRKIQLENKVSDDAVYVDSGDQTDDVYRICATYGWRATKGDQRNEFPWRINTPYGLKMVMRPYSKPALENVGKLSCRRHNFSNLRFKDTLSRLLRRGTHTRADDAGEEYVKQMQSEIRTTSNSGKPMWVVVGERANHLLDCEIINLLPAMGLKLIGLGKNRNATKDDTDKPEEDKEIDSKQEPPNP